jgi:hypothetical protein
VFGLCARFEEKSSCEKLELLQSRWKVLQELMKMSNRQYRHHMLRFVLDFDRAVGGFPKLEVLPNNVEAKFGLPFRISISYVKDKTVVKAGNLTIG